MTAVTALFSFRDRISVTELSFKVKVSWQRCAVTAVTSVTPLPVDCQRGVDASAEN